MSHPCLLSRLTRNSLRPDRSQHRTRHPALDPKSSRKPSPSAVPPRMLRRIRALERQRRPRSAKCPSLRITLNIAGDKENHVASLHLPQMLYIWPFIVFFSWPLLLPQLLDATTFRTLLARPMMTITIMAFMAAIVYGNTIVHPFTLADNRHYMFYVFRILLRHPLIKYAAIPVYYLCAYLVINALGPISTGGGERVSFVLVWLAATTLSLVTAPLVEPRYFIMPWLIWRLHVPDTATGADVAHKKNDSDSRGGTAMVHRQDLKRPGLEWIQSHVLWIELAWFLCVNGVTCWLFLKKPFEWVQEPGKLQRFMW